MLVKKTHGWEEGCGTYGIFVVVEAYFFALVLGVRAVVDDALRVVDVAILADATWRDGLGGVGDIEHEEAAFAGGATASADGVDHVLLLMGDDVVGGAEAGVEGRQVCCGAEGFWCGDCEELIGVSSGIVAEW